jgi:hypothetical protein
LKKTDKVSQNQAVTFRDYVNFDTDVTTAELSAEDIRDLASTDKDMKKVKRSNQFQHLGRQLLVLRKYDGT